MKKIVNSLLEWYYKNHRTLPWRIDKDPYHIWVSEIMLQQTRIEAVIDYYYRFIKELPTIEDLANCSQDRLLKLWEGLGYYNRARNLQRTARIIVEQYNNQFPNTYQQIIALPGIGEYTASAISSICFSLKEATVDGNVLRVYMRVNNCFDNIDDMKVRKRVRENLTKIMPKDSGNFNEALMELGETICIPKGTPKCRKCPIRNYCKAYQEQTYLELPVRQEKKIKKLENYTVFLFISNDKVAIEKRKNTGLLHNMWQFPNTESLLDLSQTRSYLNKVNAPFFKIEKGISYTHIFTHKKWNIYSYVIWLKGENSFNDTIFASLNDLKRVYAIPTAFQPLKKYLEEKMNTKKEA